MPEPKWQIVRYTTADYNDDKPVAGLSFKVLNGWLGYHITAESESILDLVTDFCAFHGKLLDDEQNCILILPMMRDWFALRGAKAVLEVDYSNHFYIRWWSALLKPPLEWLWKYQGMKVFHDPE